MGIISSVSYIILITQTYFFTDLDDQEIFTLGIDIDEFQDSSLCVSEPPQNSKLISSSPTVKIIDECVLKSQERREEERMKGERSGLERGGRC